MAMAPAGYDGTMPRVDDGERLVAGMNVFGRDGARVGTVADIGRGYFLVQDGLFTIRSMYLPRTIVARIDEEGAHLAVAKGEAESMARQDLPEAGDAWYGAQPSGIMPASVEVVEIPLREQVLVTRAVATVRSELHLRKVVTNAYRACRGHRPPRRGAHRERGQRERPRRERAERNRNRPRNEWHGSRADNLPAVSHASLPDKAKKLAGPGSRRQEGRGGGRNNRRMTGRKRSMSPVCGRWVRHPFIRPSPPSVPSRQGEYRAGV